MRNKNKKKFGYVAIEAVILGALIASFALFAIVGGRNTFGEMAGNFTDSLDNKHSEIGKEVLALSNSKPSGVTTDNWQDIKDSGFIDINKKIHEITFADGISRTIKVGETIDIEAIITPYDATNTRLVWKAIRGEENVIAIVDSTTHMMNVTGVQAGEFVAEVLSTDGGLASRQLYITVSKEVTGITLSASNLTLEVGDAPYEITAKVTPEDATNQGILWSYGTSDSNYECIKFTAKANKVYVTALKACGDRKVRLVATTDEGGYMGYVDIKTRSADDMTNSTDWSN